MAPIPYIMSVADDTEGGTPTFTVTVWSPSAEQAEDAALDTEFPVGEWQCVDVLPSADYARHSVFDVVYYRI